MYVLKADPFVPKVTRARFKVPSLHHTQQRVCTKESKSATRRLKGHPLVCKATQHSVVIHSPIHAGLSPLNIQWSPIHPPVLAHPHSTFSGHPFTDQCWFIHFYKTSQLTHSVVTHSPTSAGPSPLTHSVVTHSPTSAGLSIFTKRTRNLPSVRSATK